VIFAAGPVKSGVGVDYCLIVSDGDVAVLTVSDSLILARGKVTCLNALDCRIVSGQTVTIKGNKKGTTVTENESVPLGLVKFFEPSSEGLTVEPAKGGVRLKATEAGKPYAKAGLKPGDVITAVNGKPVDSPESFRQAFRRALAEGDKASFRVRRGDKTLELRATDLWKNPSSATPKTNKAK
jgi:S1-C subfamily serine protease